MTHMRHSTPDAVLLVMPRDAWDALAATGAPDVRRALESLVQIDRVLHVAAAVRDDRIERLAASVHLDAAEAAAAGWATDPDTPVLASITVISVPVGLDRATEVAP